MVHEVGNAVRVGFAAALELVEQRDDFLRGLRVLEFRQNFLTGTSRGIVREAAS